MLKSIAIRIDMDLEDDIFEIGKECIMYFDKKTCIDDIRSDERCSGKNSSIFL